MSVSRPPGLPASLVYPEVPVGAILLGSARRYGDRVALLAAQPRVLAAAVVGRPDDAVGELLVAFVVAYKRLREVVFVDRIPVSAAGKVLKRELRSRLS